MAHASNAAKRAALLEIGDEEPGFQIAPMIDILLVLLVFFMAVSSTEVLQTNDLVNLPTARDARDCVGSLSTRGQTIVNVLWNQINHAGSFDVDGQTFAEARDLIPLLKQKLNALPMMGIVVRADKSVRYEYMRQLLKAIGTAGGTNVTFSVVDKEPGGAPAPPAP